MQNPFVQHSADMSVAGHASSTRSADLRHAPDGLGFVFRNHFPNFLFRHVQTVTDRPRGIGVNWILIESLLGEVHDRHSTERRDRAGNRQLTLRFSLNSSAILGREVTDVNRRTSELMDRFSGHP